MPPAPPDPAPPPSDARVFSPGRLRGYRDLRKLDRLQLAQAAQIAPAAIVAYETGTDRPNPHVLATLAAALQTTIDHLHGKPNVDDSWEYWEVICAHMPPMSNEQIATVATVLRRIQRRSHDNDERPRRAA